MREPAQLIAYADRLGGSLRGLAQVLSGPLEDAFDGVHLLPFYERIDGADAGFDPIDHQRVDERVGTWEDVRWLAGQTNVMADLIVNHMSAQSEQFRDFCAKGDESEFANMFLTYGKVFPEGASQDDLAAIYRPRPGLPFTPMDFDDGTRRLLWTTFTRDQVDLDLFDPGALNYLRDTLFLLAENGVRLVRLDAVGYAIKKAGTSCFLIPDTLDGLQRVTELAGEMGVKTVAEVHAHHSYQWRLAECVDYVYDFALAPLVLHGILTGDSQPLARWLAKRPHNALTVLDTHDGIGIIDAADDPRGLEGLLNDEQIEALFAHVYEHTGDGAQRANERSPAELNRYRLNCTWYSAVGQDDDLHLLSRLIQLFTPGLPQLYYVGLLAGANDQALLAQTGEARDINRHRYTRSEIASALRRPVVRATLNAVRLRNEHPAFAGEFSFTATANALQQRWEHGEHWAELSSQLDTGEFRLTVSGRGYGRSVDSVGRLARMRMPTVLGRS